MTTSDLSESVWKWIRDWFGCNSSMEIDHFRRINTDVGFLVHLMPIAQLHFQWRTHASLNCLTTTLCILLMPSGATLSLCRCVVHAVEKKRIRVGKRSLPLQG